MYWVDAIINFEETVFKQLISTVGVSFDIDYKYKIYDDVADKYFECDFEWLFKHIEEVIGIYRDNGLYSITPFDRFDRALLDCLEFYNIVGNNLKFNLFASSTKCPCRIYPDKAICKAIFFGMPQRYPCQTLPQFIKFALLVGAEDGQLTRDEQSNFLALRLLSSGALDGEHYEYYCYKILDSKRFYAILAQYKLSRQDSI